MAGRAWLSPLLTKHSDSVFWCYRGSGEPQRGPLAAQPHALSHGLNSAAKSLSWYLESLGWSCVATTSATGGRGDLWDAGRCLSVTTNGTLTSEPHARGTLGNLVNEKQKSGLLCVRMLSFKTAHGSQISPDSVRHRRDSVLARKIVKLLS